VIAVKLLLRSFLDQLVGSGDRFGLAPSGGS
jgi:hypothetical protein